MGMVIRQSFYTTIISYGGALIGYVNLLYLYPRFLDPDQVGVFRTVQDAAILFSPFAQFGLAQSIYRFYPRVGTDAGSERAFISILTLLALCGFGIFLVVYKIFEGSILGYVEENSREVIQYSSIILWLTLMMMFISIFEAYSRSLLKTIFPSLLREIVIRLLLSVLVIMFFVGWLNYDQFIIGSVVAYTVCLLLLLIYLAWDKRVIFTTNLSPVKSPMVKELIGYSIFSFAGTAGMIIVGKIDSLMVAGLIGLSAVAVYTTAFYMATIIEYPKRAITQVVMPLIARGFESNNIAEISKLYRKASINQFVFGALLFLGIYINLDNIFELMPRQSIYEAGKWVVVLVGIGKLIDMAFGPSSEIIVLSKYYSFNMFLIILLAAAVMGGNNFLIPVYGINGAAMSVAIALFTFNAVKFVFIWWKFGIQPFDANTAKMLAIMAAAIGLNAVIPTMPLLFIDILVRSSVVTIFYGVAILSIQVSSDANDAFATALNKVGIKSPFPHSRPK